VPRESDDLGVDCSATAAPSTDLTVSSTNNDVGTEEVILGSTGSASIGSIFINLQVADLLGNTRGYQVMGWISPHKNTSVMTRTFGPYDITYRGPMTVAEIVIHPTGW
jgi:hypothetical protein